VPFQPGLNTDIMPGSETRGEGRRFGRTPSAWNGAARKVGSAGSYAEGKKGDQDWFLVEGVTGPIPTNATSAAVELYLRQGMTGTAWLTTWPWSKKYPPPLDCRDAPTQLPRAPWPPARRVSGCACGRAWATCCQGGLKPEQASLKAAILSGNQELVAITIADLRAGDNDFQLATGTLPAGDYQLRIELLAPDRTRLAVQEVPLHQPAPGHTIAHGVCSTNTTARSRTASRSFPLGWVFRAGANRPEIPGPLGPSGGQPFNTVMCYGVNAGNTNTVREYLDELARRNLKIIYSIKDVYEGSRWTMNR